MTNDGNRVIHADDFPIEDTMCRDCEHRMSKLVVPIDLETFGIEEDEYDLEEDEELQVEIHTCLVLGQDMDFVVRECTHYSSVQNGNVFFMNNPYSV